MKKRSVRVLATANADIKAIYDWIVEVSGQPDVAEKFILLIYERCGQLVDFPEIGVARDDLLPGLRLLPFERRAAIFYRIVGDEVQIVNVLYKGRDYNELTFEA